MAVNKTMKEKIMHRRLGKVELPVLVSMGKEN